MEGEGHNAESNSWLQALPTLACLVCSAALVIFVAPPVKLERFVGDVFWARMSLGLVVFFALYGVLTALGLVAGKVSLPLGLSFERGKAEPGVGELIGLGRELRGLKDSDDRIFAQLAELAAVVEDLAISLDSVRREASDTTDGAET